MARVTLGEEAIESTRSRLSAVDAERARRYPGESGTRQPVHTCYVPAGAVTETLVEQWRAGALSALEGHADSPAMLVEALGMPAEHAVRVYERLWAKLRTEPVEDLRIDFEDGYGAPGDEQEDADAERAARVVAGWSRAGSCPANVGLRCKSFDTPVLLARGIRTLDVFLTALVEAAGELPQGFVLTFPKVTAEQQVAALVGLLARAEQRLGLAAGSLRFEIQVETTQSIMDAEGRFALPRFIAAGQGRVSGLHFGTYDYTAGCGLPAASQHLAHGACDFARHAMQVAAAGTGVRCSDGSTNVLPVGDAAAVRRGWRIHYALVRRSLDHGFYQGWDMHPGQLVSRYAAVFSFYAEHAAADAARVAGYVSHSGGAVADEPATAQALSAALLRAVDCGALDAAEVEQLTGLPQRDLASLARRSTL